MKRDQPEWKEFEGSLTRAQCESEFETLHVLNGQARTVIDCLERSLSTEVARSLVIFSPDDEKSAIERKRGSGE
jgi:hypothetical protein